MKKVKLMKLWIWDCESFEVGEEQEDYGETQRSLFEIANDKKKKS